MFDDGAALEARPFDLKFGVIVGGLERRRLATTRVPEGKHDNLLTTDPVIKMVLNSLCPSARLVTWIRTN
ncbi:MAG: hypothetical protein EXR29_02360 [Betaproteobacteria bacterium]|nr:hypothetical protein [Betaproteobacteria bacterium]